MITLPILKTNTWLLIVFHILHINKQFTKTLSVLIDCKKSIPIQRYPPKLNSLYIRIPYISHMACYPLYIQHGMLSHIYPTWHVIPYISNMACYPIYIYSYISNSYIQASHLNSTNYLVQSRGIPPKLNKLSGPKQRHPI